MDLSVPIDKRPECQGCELKERDYWKARCLAAEKFIEESPCDPDINDKQIEAHSKWHDFKMRATITESGEESGQLK